MTDKGHSHKAPFTQAAQTVSMAEYLRLQNAFSALLAEKKELERDNRQQENTIRTLIARVDELSAKSTQYEVVIHDMAEEIVTLEQQAMFDAKTKLLNQSQMELMGSQMLATAKRHIAKKINEEQQVTPNDNMVVIYFDVNGLKLLNDNLGHDAGDALIKTFGAALANKFSRQSDLVFRTSGAGDEFVVIINNTDEVEAKDFIEGTINELNQTLSFEYDDNIISVVTSYGYTDYNWQADMDENLGQIVKRAEADMYARKEELKNSPEKLTTKIRAKENAAEVTPGRAPNP